MKMFYAFRVRKENIHLKSFFLNSFRRQDVSSNDIDKNRYM